MRAPHWFVPPVEHSPTRLLIESVANHPCVSPHDASPNATPVSGWAGRFSLEREPAVLVEMVPAPMTLTLSAIPLRLKIAP